MLTVFPIAVFVGLILGFLAGLGVGGGSLLVLWLTVVVNMDMETAGCVNLLFFLCAAGISSLFRIHQGTIPWKTVIPAMATGCIMAGIFSYIGTIIETSLLKRMFGILLIFTGFRELFYRRRKAR